MLLQAALFSFYGWAVFWGGVCVCVSVCVCVYHSLFIHSSVSGHLSCFHVLAVKNGAAVNIAAAAAAKSHQSCPTLRPHRRQPTRLLCPWDSPGKNTGVGCHFLLQCRKVKSESEAAQLCPTLSDPMDCSPPGSSVHGILQARGLECSMLNRKLY